MTYTQDPISPAAEELELNAVRDTQPAGPDRTRRILLAVAAIGLFGPALIAWSSIIQLPAVGVISTGGCAGAILLVALAVTSKTDRSLDHLDLVILVMAIVILGAWAATELYFYPAYGTDEAAFVQYAAQLLMHGRDPYTVNLLPALTQFRVPIQYATYKLNGTVASNLAYPSLSFLLVVPAIQATNGVQAVIAENVVALTVEMILLFFFLPRRFRALAIVVVAGLPFLFDYTIGGDIVTLAIPFMLVVAYRWTDIGRQGSLGTSGVLRAVCLGLAASICQFPWFVAPFVVLGLWLLRSKELGPRRATSLVSRFSGLAGGVFLLVNAPFLVWAPSAWFSDVMSPLLQRAIPFGQGLIDATAFYRIGGGDLSYYTDAAVLSLVALLLVYGVYFSRLWMVAFICPSVVFVFSTRSLSEYFIMMVAMWIVSLAAPGHGHAGRTPEFVGPRFSNLDRAGVAYKRWLALDRRYVVAAPILAVAICILLAMTSPAPLQVRIQSVETNGQFGTIWQISAFVKNHSSKSLVPHFATDASGYMTTFWNVVSGPRRLGPGQQALYKLVAPNVGSMPGVTQPFMLQAVTASPQTISSSGVFTPEPFDCVISPSYVDGVVPLGQSVTLHVDLRSPYGGPVHRGGVPVALGQVVYGQSALIPGEAQINSAPVGQSPVIALSDSDGVATFHIRDSAVQGGNPLYFQAYVYPQSGFPYGYSGVVSVQWSS